MTLTEILISTVLGLSSFIFLYIINGMKTEISRLWNKVDNLKEADNQHALEDSRRFGEVGAMIAKKDAQFDEIMRKIDALVTMVQNVLNSKEKRHENN